MINGQKVVVVMPAYNAAETLEKTYNEIPHHLVDEIVLVDDASADHTADKAKELGIRHVIVHADNMGYGANQKTCYEKAISLNADIIIMLHPDYQYTPLLIPAMSDMIASGLYDVVLGSRILSGGALAGGMPYYKYIANRFLTFTQNLLVGHKLSEYHTGYRAYNAKLFAKIDISMNSDDFVFDNQILSQIIFANFKIGEITCPTKYFPEASSINFKRSLKYGLGVLIVSVQHKLHKIGMVQHNRYRLNG